MQVLLDSKIYVFCNIFKKYRITVNSYEQPDTLNAVSFFLINRFKYCIIMCNYMQQEWKLQPQKSCGTPPGKIVRNKSQQYFLSYYYPLFTTISQKGNLTVLPEKFFSEIKNRIIINETLWYWEKHYNSQLFKTCSHIICVVRKFTYYSFIDFSWFLSWKHL